MRLRRDEAEVQRITERPVDVRGELLVFDRIGNRDLRPSLPLADCASRIPGLLRLRRDRLAREGIELNDARCKTFPIKILREPLGIR